MLSIWGVLTALTVLGGGPSVVGIWWFERSRARRRNRVGRCAACGTPWADTSSGDPYLIHGRLVCEACGERARRRMPWHFGALGLAAALATALVTASADDFALMILFPAASTLVMTLGAVQLMKLANRSAQRRIAAGEYPDLAALRPAPRPEERAGVSSGRVG